MKEISVKIMIKIIAAIVIFTVAVLLYLNFNPALVNIFPPCIFKTLTGYKCPGCGSQRTIHHLLNLDALSALRMNPLLVVSLPYIIIGLLLEYTNLGKLYPKLKRVLFGRIAISIVFFVVVVYWITRNIFDF